MSSLDEIPTTERPPAHARPSDVVGRIRSYRPSRRAVLRGLVIGAAAAALVPLDWYLARRGAAAAPESTSEHTGCAPSAYDEDANNWPEGDEAVCYGGWRRGSYPCEDGYHREGAHSAGGERFVSTRLTSSCRGKNAWRWKGYRCSDAMTTTTFDDGTEYNATTIAACALPAGVVADEPEDDAEGGSTSPAGGSGSGRPDGGDSSAPRDGGGLLPLLGG
jgi:hypothetical protein